MLAVVVIVISVVIIVVDRGPVARQVGDLVGAGTAVLVWNIVKWPVLVVLVSLFYTMQFKASPNAKQSGIGWVSPGGVIAVLIWLGASALFALYVSTFASYDKTYGSIAGVVIFLVWLWLANIALLLGAEVNAEVDHSKAIAEGLPPDVEPFAEARDTAEGSTTTRNGRPRLSRRCVEDWTYPGRFADDRLGYPSRLPRLRRTNGVHRREGDIPERGIMTDPYVLQHARRPRRRQPSPAPPRTPGRAEGRRVADDAARGTGTSSWRGGERGGRPGCGGGQDPGLSLWDQASSTVVAQVADQKDTLVSWLRNLADELKAMADSAQHRSNGSERRPRASPDIATGLAQRGADYAQRTASWLSHREPSAVLDEVGSFARRRPGTFLALAAAAGIVVGRLTRGLAAGVGRRRLPPAAPDGHARRPRPLRRLRS